MNSQPGVEDFRGIDLGDDRRNDRLMSIAMQVAEQPKATLPEIAGSDAALEALYRFLNNPAIDFGDLLEPVQAAAAERARSTGSAIVLHDTTSFEFAHADAKQVGYLQTGKAGFYAHFSLVVSADGERRPLGVAAVQMTFRTKRSRRRNRNEPGSTTTKRPDRESKRWEDGVEQSEELLADCQERIHVADREADGFQLLALLQQKDCKFVVRMRHDRAARAADDDEAEWSKLKTLTDRADVCLERDVPLTPRRGATAPRQARAYPKRKARRATLRFAARRVVLRRPQYFGNELPETIELNIVRVYEVDVPSGQEPVEWLLATSEPVDSAEQVARIVDIYRTRWVIEEFFKALKTGCAYEERQLESRHALLNALALFLPVACQLLWLRSRAHHAPDAPATDVLTPRQIVILRSLHHKPLPAAPTAKEALAAIASIGGHWKSNGEPGWQILRRGFQKMLEREHGWVLLENTQRNAINR